MSIAVFYFDANIGIPSVEMFADTALLECLALAERLRKAGMRHVCISSELSSNIGKAGVTAVEGGKTPDGENYTWVKRR